MGLAYYNGNGVPPNFKEAVKWYRLAAYQGNPKAQHDLGMAYYRGEGVAQDYVKAYAWVQVAAEHGDKGALDSQSIVMEKITFTQVEEAQRLSQEYRLLSK